MASDKCNSSNQALMISCMQKIAIYETKAVGFSHKSPSTLTSDYIGVLYV